MNDRETRRNLRLLRGWYYETEKKIYWTLTLLLEFKRTQQKRMKMLGRNLCSAWKQHRLLLNRLIGNWDSVTFNPYESYIKGLIIGACSCVPFCMYTFPLFYFILFIYLLFILFRVCLIQPYSTNLLYHHIQLIQRHSTRLWTTYNMPRSPQEIQSSTSLPPYLMTSFSLPHDIFLAPSWHPLWYQLPTTSPLYV